MSKKKQLQIISFYNNKCCYGEYKTFFSSINDECKITNNYILEKPWRMQVIERDLNLLNISVNTSKKTTYENDFEIKESFNKIIKCFSDVFSINIKSFPKLYIVEQLPAPFDKRTWSAMSVDINDELEFGIPWGIYFLKKTIIRGYFEILLSHEIIHWIISEYSKNQNYYPYVPWIEEGFADIVGMYILLLCNAMPSECIYNFLSTNRSCCKPDDMKFSYWNACKQVTEIALSYGFNEVLAIIKKGREAIINIHYKETNSNYIKDTDITWLRLLEILIKCNNNFTIPIDEYAVYYACFKTNNIIELSEILAMPEDYLSMILKKLTEKNLLVYADGKIYNFTKFICPHIKYIF